MASRRKRREQFDFSVSRRSVFASLIAFILLIISVLAFRQTMVSAQDPARSPQLAEIAGKDLAGIAAVDETGCMVLAERSDRLAGLQVRLWRTGRLVSLADAPMIEGSLVGITRERAGSPDVYFGTGMPGQIGRVSSAGGFEVYLTLPGEDGLVTTLTRDDTSASGRELIAGTSRGNIWRVDGYGRARLAASLGPEFAVDSLAAPGGRILAVSRGLIHRIDADGRATILDFGIPRTAAVIEIRRAGNIYAVVADDSGRRSLRVLSSPRLDGYTGGLLIAQAANEVSPMALYAVDEDRVDKLAEAGNGRWIQLAISNLDAENLQSQNGVVPAIGPFGNPTAAGPTDTNDDFTFLQVIVPKDDGLSSEAANARFIVTLKNIGATSGNIGLSATAIPAGFGVSISLDSGASFIPLRLSTPVGLPNPLDPGEERNIDVRLTVPAGTPVNAVYDLVLMAEAGPGAFNRTICRTSLVPPVPMLTLDKTALDLDGGVLHPGDLIEYTLTVGNFSSWPVTRAFVVDYLPPQIQYLENSVRIVGGANAGPKTDAMDGDQVDYFPGPGGQINIGVGAGAGGHANGFLVGGTLMPGDVTSIVFRAMVREGICCGTVIVNGAEWGGDGVYPGGRSNLVQNIVRIANPLIGPFGDPGATGPTGINDDTATIRLNLDVSGGMTMDSGSVRIINTLQNNGTAAGRFIILAPAIPAGFTVRASVDSGSTFVNLNDGGSVVTQTALDPGEFRNIDLRVDYPVGLVIGQPYDIVLMAVHEDDDRRTNQTIDRIVIDPIVPGLDLRKGVFDLNGRSVDGKTVYQGQDLEYRLMLSNRSGLRVTRTFVTDRLPAGVTFLPGSIRILAGPNAGAKTDAQGDDQADFLPNEGPAGLLTVYTGSDASFNRGGWLDPGESVEMAFRVRVNKDGLTGSVISNFGEWGAEEFFTAGRSNVVRFTVGEHCRPTVITVQPVTTAACAGGTAVFSAVADGTEIAWQWRRNGEPIPGATSDKLVIDAVGSGDAAGYDVVVTGVCGVVTSDAVNLTLLAPPIITRHPTDVFTSAWGVAVFSVEATGDGLTYQWRRNGVPIPGAGAASFTITSVRTSDEGDYDVVVTGLCGSIVSATAKLVVICTPTIPPLFRLPDGFVGVPYSHTVDLPFPGVSITQDFVPPGLTFNTTTGKITGTPTKEGEYTITAAWLDDRGCPTGIFYRIVILKREFPACSTLCYRSALYYWINFGTSAIPAGTVVIDGINGGAGISTRDPRVRLALQGFLGALNRELVAFQLNILGNGGVESPGVITALASRLDCYGLAFDEVTVLGRRVSPSTSLFDLMQLAREVGRGENSLTQSRDACLIGKILRALNGEGLTPLCNRTGGAISFTGCN